MPKQDSGTGKVRFKERHINETTFDIDRGPNESCQNVFEIKLHDRMFTLYTHDNTSMENFVLYIEKILELKDELLFRQKQEDHQIAMIIQNHNEKQMRKVRNRSKNLSLISSKDPQGYSEK